MKNLETPGKTGRVGRYVQLNVVTTLPTKRSLRRGETGSSHLTLGIGSER